MASNVVIVRAFFHSKHSQLLGFNDGALEFLIPVEYGSLSGDIAQNRVGGFSWFHWGQYFFRCVKI